MRRTASPLSLILLGLGTFLLVLAPMLAWYVTPRAAVNPVDI
ncbi:porin PorA family protein, partial [Streptomyces nigra]